MSCGFFPCDLFNKRIVILNKLITVKGKKNVKTGKKKMSKMLRL